MTSLQSGEPGQLTSKRLILALQEFGEREVIYAVGSGSEEQVKPQLVLQVPASFVLTEGAYQEFIHQTRLDEVIEGLLTGVNVKDIDALKEPAAQIRQIISAALMPKSLCAQIQRAYQWLGHGRVVLRLVTTPYEMLHPAGGRHQRPFLEAEGIDGVLQAIKSWWAALFSVEAVFYRELYRQKHSDIRTVLAVQQAGEM